MRTIHILSVLLFLFSPVIKAQEIHDYSRNLLGKQANVEQLQSQILPYGQWVPFSKDAGSDAWINLPDTVKNSYLAAANNALAFEWPVLPATLYMEYARNGNRTNFQNVYFMRRTVLSDLVIGEMIEGKGRFTDQIVNGIWAICEESSWCIPAHTDVLPLPNVNAPVVDLFAAETGTTLSWTYYLLKDQLDQISPLISKRIEDEMEERLFTPWAERDDFWWMGFGERKDVNNWNPWIISNWLTCVLLVEKDQKARAAQISKAMRSLDNFINIYPPDGGCDEGPGYWGHAGGAMFYCLDILKSASDGAIDLFDEPLIRNIGAYIYKAHIAGDYFVNFADASATIGLDADVVYRYGKSIDDPVMMKFAAFALKNRGFRKGSYTMGRKLESLFSYNEIMKAESGEPLVLDVWLPESQIVASRSQANSRNGLYFAAKGGHNGESHNHNDVGNFIVYYNGQPVIIDIGVENYTRKTFSSKRYDIWTMQSQYHSLPTVNGVMQSPGRGFHSSDVQYSQAKSKVTFSLDLKEAYPEEAGIESWHRTLTFNKGRQLTVTENYTLNKINGETFFSFMTPCLVEIAKQGTILLRDPSNGFEVTFTYDATRLTPETEEYKLEDSRLRSAWGDRLFRIKLISKNPALKGKISYAFKGQ
jgi:hypothetical protein